MQLLEDDGRLENIHLKAERSNSVSDVWKVEQFSSGCIFLCTARLTTAAHICEASLEFSSQVGIDHIYVIVILRTDGLELDYLKAPGECLPISLRP